MENDVDLPFNIAGKPPEKGGMYNGDEQWRNITPDYLSVPCAADARARIQRGRFWNSAAWW